ncbi:MAG: LysR substrate-binding domain-containing protein [Dermatophilaceae bacterium]
MNLRDLEYLVSLADHRHFGRAAAACHVSQPTMSTQIKKLETELKVSLVERGARQVMLTRAGQDVVARARDLLDDAEQIRRIAQASADPESGTLRLGMFPTLAPYLLPHVVGAIRDRFPRLELLLVEEKSPELIERLKLGSLDAAVLALPVIEDSLSSVPLFREDFLLALPSGHPLADLPEPLSVDILAGQELLLLEDGHCLRDQALAVCSLAGGKERSGFRATSLETLRHMVATGGGITLLPELSVSPPVIAHPRLVLRRLEHPAPHRDLALVRRASHVDPSLIEDLAAVIRRAGQGLTHALV